tara:strand:- start:164 stop:1183 length:1020 start_codon:yes stop_codon:yes gene_type:complete
MNEAQKSHILEVAKKIEVPNQVTKTPLVSVIVQTFNQEDTIAQCLESILIQKTDFDFEILVGEDFSSDRTRQICTNYAVNYPSKIRLFRHTGNDKIHFGGKPTGRFNTYTNLFNARGKYLAICEGDDHWNGPDKLQKQADAFESDPSIGLCFHAVYINHFGRIHDDSNDATTKKYESISDKENITYKTLLQLNNYIHTASIMLRRKDLVENIENLPLESPALDIILSLIASSEGRIHKIQGRYATYRLGIGVWSSMPEWEKQMKWKWVLKSMLDLDFLDAEDRQGINLSLDQLDHAALKSIQSWTVWEHLKHQIRISILNSPFLRRGYMEYQKVRRFLN